MEVPKIRITKRVVGKYPYLTIYTIKIGKDENKGTILGSRHDARIYLSGAIDILSTLGFKNIIIPPIPR